MRNTPQRIVFLENKGTARRFGAATVKERIYEPRVPLLKTKRLSDTLSACMAARRSAPSKVALD